MSFFIVLKKNLLYNKREIGKSGVFCLENNEKKSTIKVKKKPVGPASYVPSNISFVNGKVEYEKSYKTVADYENDIIAKKYVAKLKEQQKEQENKKNSSSVKRKALTSTEEHNLFKKLNISEEDKKILLDLIKYSLTEREQKLLKAYFGYSYDGYYRQSTTSEDKKNVNIIVKKLRVYLKQAKEVLSVNVFKYRVYLLSFKNKLEYVDQDIFKNVSNAVLKTAYKKLTIVEARVAKDYFNPSKAEDLTDEELIIFTNDIFPKLKVYVYNPKGIDAYFKAYSEVEQKILRIVLKLLSDSQRNLVKKKFGEKFDGINLGKLSVKERTYFTQTIFPKIQDKYQELLKLNGSTDYYIALIKGFSKINLEKHCNIQDDTDKKILLALLENLNENDKEILFSTNQLTKMDRNRLSYERDIILTYLKKSILELKKVYNSREVYNELLGNLLNGKQIREIKQEQILKKKVESKDIILSFENYLEKVSIKVLEDAINYGLKEQEKSFLCILFDGNYKNNVITKSKNKSKKFNTINIKINSLVTYLSDLNEVEYENFITRLKEFPKEEDYNQYQFKELSTYLEIPLNETLKYIIKNGLEKEERLLLQKRFGLTYEGFLVEKITSKEKYKIRVISNKIIKQYALLKDCGDLEDEKRLELLSKASEKQPREQKSYKYTSLIEYLGIKEEEKETFYEVMKNIFNEEERLLLQKRFGVLYDGIGAERVTRDDNNRILIYLIPRLKNALNNKLRKQSANQIETLKGYLGLNDEEAKNIELAVSTLIIEHIELLQKMFGPLYDEVDSKLLTKNEKIIVSHTIKPKLLEAIQLINETDEKDLANELDKLASKNKFGYQNLSLYDVLSLSSNDKELLINAIDKVFSKEEINLLQRRFGPLYDGVGITGVTREENIHISQCLILRLKWEVNKKLEIAKKENNNYKIKSLFKCLNVEEKDKHIVLDIINILSLEDQQLFQKRFGPLYDGEDVKETTKSEKERIFKTLIPKVKEMFLVLSETSISQYIETLKKVTYEYQKKTKKRKNSILTRVTTIEEFEKEQSKEDTPKTTCQKVVSIEEVEVREQKVNKEDENIIYIKNLLEILEEEKKGLFKNYREKLQYFKHNMALLARKLKIYSQELSSYGFTDKEAAFLLLSTTEGLDLSNNQVMSILKIQKDELREISLSSAGKIQNLISVELDSYISFLKEMRNNNE